MSTDLTKPFQQAPAVTESDLQIWWRGKSPSERYLRHFTAIVIWGYFFLQLFVFDFDAWLIAHLPGWLDWIIEYKLLVFSLIAALILNFVSRRRFWSWALYIALYPLSYSLLLLWNIVKFTAWILIKLQSWTALFVLLNFVFGIFASFKINLLIYIVAIIGVIVALLSANSSNLISAAFLLVGVIIVLLLRRLISVFKPTPIFNTYVRAMAWVMAFCRNKIIKPVSVKGIDPTQYTLADFENKYGQLSTAVMLSEACGFLESKFRSYRKSGIAIATYLLSLAFLFAISVLLFGIANFAIFRADSTQYVTTADHNVFSFIYYSFGAISGQRINEIYPQGTTARFFSMFATSLSWLFVAGSLLSLYLGIRRERDDAEIESAIAKLQKEREKMNQYVEEGFSLSLDQAIVFLENLKGGLKTIIALLRGAQSIR